MRQFRVIVGAGALGALVWTAAVAPVTAADIPVKAPVQAPPPAYNWYGFFIGAHGGYGWGRNAVEASPDPFFLAPFAAGAVPFSAGGNPHGFIGGVQWGSNWQFGRVVLGTESDFSYTDIKASQTFSSAFGGQVLTTNSDQRLKWFGTTRVRAGVTIVDNVLLYGTGGLASGRVESSASVVGSAGCLPGNCVFGSGAQDRWGWAAGGGIEYGNGPWSLKVEYLHYDLGTLDYNVFDPQIAGALVRNSVHFSGDMVRGAVSYRFNWTPWELLFGRGRI